MLRRISCAGLSRFATNVDVESSLHNQFFALQKCEQAEYVPSSMSDMYQVHIDARPEINQPFPGLFQRTELSTQGYTGVAGKNVFDNHTRQQRMDSTCIHNKL